MLDNLGQRKFQHSSLNKSSLRLEMSFNQHQKLPLAYSKYLSFLYFFFQKKRKWLTIPLLSLMLHFHFPMFCLMIVMKLKISRVFFFLVVTIHKDWKGKEIKNNMISAYHMDHGLMHEKVPVVGASITVWLKWKADKQK